MKIIFASKNKGKLKEVKKNFESDKIEIISLLDFNNPPDVEETGSSFLENSILKAKEIYEKYKLPVIADDSGLEVEQLNGAPGVYSARYSGENATDEKNIQKLVSELEKFSEPHHARFVCFAVFYDGKSLHHAEGEVKGEIVKEQRGDNGFGYDPVFLVEGSDKTMAELDLETKNSISHRAKALNKLKEILRGLK